MTVEMKIKPLSVNNAWQGKRFKTPAYKAYEKELLFTLPKGKMPEPPFRVSYEFGFSNMQSDLDNPVKSLTDVLAKKYNFNDAHIYEAQIKKVKVSKGEEYFKVRIESIN